MNQVIAWAYILLYCGVFTLFTIGLWFLYGYLEWWTPLPGIGLSLLLVQAFRHTQRKEMT